MRLGEILVARGLVTVEGIDAALLRQRVEGGRLGENLIALGQLTAAELIAAMRGAPLTPSAAAETGIAPRNLLELMLKFMHIEACETAMELSERMKLPRRIVQQILDEASHQRFVQALGAVPGSAFNIRYGISEAGRAAAREALEQSMYIGPAPVALQDYQDQLQRQRISNEQLALDDLRRGFEGLVVPEHYLRKLLPAVNTGRSVLMFGPAGNGKTTLATRIGGLFKDIVYIPYAVEVAGQIVKVFDPALHQTSLSEAAAAVMAGGAFEAEDYDHRWMPCRRPLAAAGGELTLEMLDLQHNSDTRFYDAPLHVKAFNGMFLIDDFGRQKFKPNDLLNRWIVPMESQVDYLRLASGATFQLPFDLLLIFSTNLQPSDLMDAAFLRRIQYKIKLFAPTLAEYRQIFDAAARRYGLTLTDEVFDYVAGRLKDRFGFAYYQPRFICDQVLEACKCFNLPPQMTRELVGEALSNLYFDIDDPPDGA